MDNLSGVTFLYSSFIKNIYEDLSLYEKIILIARRFIYNVICEFLIKAIIYHSGVSP